LGLFLFATLDDARGGTVGAAKFSISSSPSASAMLCRTGSLRREWCRIQGSVKALHALGVGLELFHTTSACSSHHTQAWKTMDSRQKPPNPGETEMSDWRCLFLAIFSRRRYSWIMQSFHNPKNYYLSRFAGLISGRACFKGTNRGRELFETHKSRRYGLSIGFIVSSGRPIATSFYLGTAADRLGAPCPALGLQAWPCLAPSSLWASITPPYCACFLRCLQNTKNQSRAGSVSLVDISITGCWRTSERAAETCAEHRRPRPSQPRVTP
jgi:hypothetical protein